MSEGKGVSLSQASPLADKVGGLLSDGLCSRVAVAGSIRRKRERVCDIEIVAQPTGIRSGLFGGKSVEPALHSIRTVAAQWGELSKRGDRFVQVLDLWGTGLTLDLFLVHPPAEWGTILAIRTGPAELGQRAVTRLRRLSRRCVDGHVETVDGDRIPTPTEAHFFGACGLRYLPPEERDSERARGPVSPWTPDEGGG